MNYWISTDKFTCLVICDDNNKIIDTAPILMKFIGQSLTNLERWIKQKFYSYIKVNI